MSVNAPSATALEDDANAEASEKSRLEKPITDRQGAASKKMKETLGAEGTYVFEGETEQEKNAKGRLIACGQDLVHRCVKAEKLYPNRVEFSAFFERNLGRMGPGEMKVYEDHKNEILDSILQYADQNDVYLTPEKRNTAEQKCRDMVTQRYIPYGLKNELFCSFDEAYANMMKAAQTSIEKEVFHELADEMFQLCHEAGITKAARAEKVDALQRVMDSHISGLPAAMQDAMRTEFDAPIKPSEKEEVLEQIQDYAPRYLKAIPQAEGLASDFESRLNAIAADERVASAVAALMGGLQSKTSKYEANLGEWNNAYDPEEYLGDLQAMESEVLELERRAAEPEEEPEEDDEEDEPKTDPEADPETDPEADPEADPETDPEVDPEADPEADPETDPEVDPEADTDSADTSDTSSAVRSETSAPAESANDSAASADSASGDSAAASAESVGASTATESESTSASTETVGGSTAAAESTGAVASESAGGDSATHASVGGTKKTEQETSLPGQETNIDVDTKKRAEVVPEEPETVEADEEDADETPDAEDLTAEVLEDLSEQAPAAEVNPEMLQKLYPDHPAISRFLTALSLDKSPAMTEALNALYALAQIEDFEGKTFFTVEWLEKQQKNTQLYQTLCNIFQSKTQGLEELFDVLRLAWGETHIPRLRRQPGEEPEIEEEPVEEDILEEEPVEETPVEDAELEPDEAPDLEAEKISIEDILEEPEEELLEQVTVEDTPEEPETVEVDEEDADEVFEAEVEAPDSDLHATDEIGIEDATSEMLELDEDVHAVERDETAEAMHESVLWLQEIFAGLEGIDEQDVLNYFNFLPSMVEAVAQSENVDAFCSHLAEHDPDVLAWLEDIESRDEANEGFINMIFSLLTAQVSVPETLEKDEIAAEKTEESIDMKPMLEAFQASGKLETAISGFEFNDRLQYLQFLPVFQNAFAETTSFQEFWNQLEESHPDLMAWVEDLQNRSESGEDVRQILYDFLELQFGHAPEEEEAEEELPETEEVVIETTEDEQEGSEIEVELSEFHQLVLAEHPQQLDNLRSLLEQAESFDHWMELIAGDTDIQNWIIEMRAEHEDFDNQFESLLRDLYVAEFQTDENEVEVIEDEADEVVEEIVEDAEDTEETDELPEEELIDPDELDELPPETETKMEKVVVALLDQEDEEPRDQLEKVRQVFAAAESPEEFRRLIEEDEQLQSWLEKHLEEDPDFFQNLYDLLADQNADRHLRALLQDSMFRHKHYDVDALASEMKQALEQRNCMVMSFIDPADRDQKIHFSYLALFEFKRRLRQKIRLHSTLFISVENDVLIVKGVEVKEAFAFQVLKTLHMEG